ncbi:MAG: hypothetical protein L3J01_04705 [Thiomicrorhabdus sp.]|nr:hypothetical protein [Thiomicrorhabdus sp.]
MSIRHNNNFLSHQRVESEGMVAFRKNKTHNSHLLVVLTVACIGGTRETTGSYQLALLGFH